MSLEIFLLIVAIVFILLLLACLPVIWQVWKTIKSASVALETINKNLPVILKNVEEITGNIHNSTATVNDEIQTLGAALNRFYSATSGIIGDVRSLSPQAVKGSFVQLISNGLAIVKGVRVFLDVFLGKK